MSNDQSILLNEMEIWQKKGFLNEKLRKILKIL